MDLVKKLYDKQFKKEERKANFLEKKRFQGLTSDQEKLLEEYDSKKESKKEEKDYLDDFDDDFEYEK